MFPCKAQRLTFAALETSSTSAVHICQQLKKDKAKGGQFYIQEGTKNGQSRILDVPDFLLEILQEEKQRQLRARLAAGPAWPRFACTVFRSSPFTNASVALVCRRSCTRASGSPILAAMRLKFAHKVCGLIHRPSASVKHSPHTFCHAGPAARAARR